MKHIYFLSIAIFFSVSCIAQNSSLQLISSNSNGCDLSFVSGKTSYSILDNEHGSFTVLHCNGLSKSYDVSNPDLPVFTKLIEVPNEGSINVIYNSKISDTTDLALEGFHYEISPSQPSLFKNQSQYKEPFAYNSLVYSSNEFYSQDLVSIEVLGKMRGKTIARITIAPFAYNPITNHLIQTTQFDFNIEFERTIEDVSSGYHSYEHTNYFSKLINTNNQEKNDFVQHPIKMVILSDPMFEDQLQDFISWKKRKGFEIVEVYKGNEGVGSSFQDMKAYLRSIYESTTDDSPAPTYLLIVGDHEQIPSAELNGHVSDMLYAEYDGNGDYFPELFVGRFSASSSSELASQLTKTMEYEKYEMPDPSYLGEALMVAGVDNFYASSHGNGQINYGVEYYFNEDHDIETYTYLYPESDSPASEAQIISHINDGVGFANYTAHCGPTGWSEPSFDVNDVQSLNNEGEYGLFIGNCCQSNAFNGITCLGESLLRGEKKGAVGYIGGSNNTLWDEDYYWSVGHGPVSANPTYNETSQAAYDCSFHENGEAEEYWTITQGQILQAGNWAVTESSSNNIEYYWEIYHLMGDPSVLTYYGVPSELSINHPESLIIGSSSIQINAEPYTYVALNQNNILLDASYTDANGNVTLNFEPLTSIDAVELVASKQNRQVYINQLLILGADAPYVTATDLVLDGVFEQGETVNLELNLENYGAVSAQDLTISLNTLGDSAVIIQNNIMYIDSISGSSTLQTEGLTTIDLVGPFEDQESVTLSVVITDADGEEWVSNLSFSVNAPNLEFVSHSIDDANSSGIVEFGESAVLNLNIENLGTVNSSIGNVSFSSDFEYVSFTEDQIQFNSINTNDVEQVNIPFTLNEDAPNGVTYTIDIIATTENGLEANYSVELQTSYCAIGSMEIQLIINTDTYAYETYWSLFDSDGQELENTSENTLSANETYVDIFCYDEYQYYTFEIGDSYGDGINGEGYSIVICGETVATGGDFDYGETISFISSCDQSLSVGCTNPDAENYDENALVDDGSCIVLSIEELKSKLIVYPNPVESYLVVDFADDILSEIQLHTVTGQHMLSYYPKGTSSQLDLVDITSGLYMLHCKTESGFTITKPLVIK